MEEKNDLMKDLTQSDSKNLRKYLIIGGGFFVIFVVGIVIAKFLFSSPKKDNTTVILPPEIQQDKKDTNLFNNIPIETQNKQQIPKEPLTDTPKEEFKKPEVEKPITPPQPIQKPKQTTPIETETIKPTPKPKPKTIQKPKQTTKTQYYIQVAAVTRGEPNPKFLKLIKKNGFTYKIEEVTIKGKKIKRVLVGGFKTKQEALKALPKVKKSISSSAFIKRVK